MVRDGVADDFAVVHVQYRRQEALVPADVYPGHVGDPLLVGTGRGEVPVDDVRRGLARFALVGAVLATPADVPRIFFLHDAVHRLVVDCEALVPQFVPDAAVAVAAPVFRVYGLDPPALVGVAVGLFPDVVVVRGAGKTARLQEMFEGVLSAQSPDYLGPTPNIPAFSSRSRAFNFFR